MSLLTKPEPSRGLDNSEGNTILKSYRPGGPLTVMKSGDLITLTTDDPKVRPLPSFRLLQLQWFCQRVTRMSGAAEVYDEAFYDSDDDISNHGLEEELDLSFISEDSLTEPTMQDLLSTSVLPSTEK